MPDVQLGGVTTTCQVTEERLLRYIILINDPEMIMRLKLKCIHKDDRCNKEIDYADGSTLVMRE